jgi:hypothetical protein
MEAALPHVQGRNWRNDLLVMQASRIFPILMHPFPGFETKSPDFRSCLRRRVLYCSSMAIQKKNAFSRRLPDLVTEELVAVLSQRKSFEFKQLFEVVHENLRQRNAASGGEEMLRLRAYEKLQNLVARGVVKKTGKSYKGDTSALAAMAAQNAAQTPVVIAKT